MPTENAMSQGLPSTRNGWCPGLDQPHRQHMRIACPGAELHHHGEFVATHARRHAGTADDGFEPVRHFLQQLVATGMAERVVDALEAVEIDQQQRETAQPRRFGHAFAEPLLQHVPVRQPGQRIVIGAMRQLVLQPREFRDVLVRRYPAAAGQRLVRHRYRLAGIELADFGRGEPALGQPHAVADIGFDIGADMAVGGDPAAQHILERRARPGPAAWAAGRA